MTDLAKITPDPDASLLNLIERASRDPSVDVAKLEALLAMQERVLAREAKRRYTEAMTAVAAELEPVGKDARNPHIGNRYATLGAIDAVLRPIYTKHGFAISYGTEQMPGNKVYVTCTVSHSAGHATTLGLPGELDTTGTRGGTSKTSVQATGSTVTYLKRYLLVMAFNVQFFDQDDDGEAARKAAQQSQRTIKPPSQSRAENGAIDIDTWFGERAQEFAAANTPAELDQMVGYWRPAVERMKAPDLARWSRLIEDQHRRLLEAGDMGWQA